MEDIVAMARAAEKDETLSDGALYGKLADRIEQLQGAPQRRPGASKLVYDKERRTIVSVPTIVDCLQRVLAAYGSQRDDIPDSDLDDEQPISLTVSLRLGDIRKARNFVSLQGLRPCDFSTRSPER